MARQVFESLVGLPLMLLRSSGIWQKTGSDIDHRIPVLQISHDDKDHMTLMRIAVTCQTRSHGSFQQSTMVRHSQDLCNALKMQNNPLNYSEIRVCFSNSYPSPFNNQFNRKRSSQSRRSITTLPNHADLKLSPSKPRKTRYRCPILLTLF